MGQLAHAPATTTWPAGQLKHALAAGPEKVPGGQVAQDIVPLLGLKVPTVQGSQDVCWMLPWKPAWHTEHTVAPEDEYEPSAHAEQD